MCVFVCVQVSQCVTQVLALQGQQATTAGDSSSKCTSSRAASSLLKLENNLLSQANSFCGQSLVASSSGSVNRIRQALEAFMDSARYVLYALT